MTESAPQFEGIMTTFAWDDAIEDLYTSWRDEVLRAGYAHETLARRLRLRWIALGLVVVVAAVCAGVIALAPVVARDAYLRATASIDRDAIPIAVATLAAVAAVLTIVQIVAPSAVRAERHRTAASRYRSLDRAMAATLALPREARPSPDSALAWVRERLTRYERQSPVVASRRWAKLAASFEAAGASDDSASPTPAMSDAQGFLAT
jgi:hypothetical protein